MKTNFALTGIPLTLLVLTMFASCEKSDVNPKDGNRVYDLDSLIVRNLEKVTVDQGVTGTVIVMEGNCMPHISEEPEPNPDCIIYTAQRTVYVYEYTMADQVVVDPGLNLPYFFSHIETELVKTTTSDADGFFEVALPPGTYSLFIREKDALYANLWDSHGGIQPVTVGPDEMASVVLKISHAALF